MPKWIRLMDDEEREKFIAETRQHWKNLFPSDLERGLRFNLRTKQQIELRIQVIQEILNERESRDGKKSHQFLD